MGAHRWSRGVATLMVALVALTGCVSAEPGPPPGPLRILLVNDDGWDAPGVVVLREALRRAGHTVAQVSPEGDASDVGTTTTLAGPITSVRPTPDPEVWFTSGTPADAAWLGIYGLMGAPDLVISGIDDRYTASITGITTGTVGAAMTAAIHNTPAVAVGTAPAEPGTPIAPVDLERVAEFTVRLVEELQDRPDGARLVPERTVLNVNYPRGPEPARDVVATRTSDVPLILPRTVPSDRPDTVVLVPEEVPRTDFDDDISALADGSITLTDLSADPDRSTPPVRAAGPLADRLAP